VTNSSDNEESFLMGTTNTPAGFTEALSDAAMLTAMAVIMAVITAAFAIGCIAGDAARPLRRALSAKGDRL
jgi:hypothetical protein